MITNNDLTIENLSYTKKDFGQIYPELLDLAKQLSSKWDPTNTNESDPGIVLLKLAAFVADKNNYNIDKNVLEQFLTSCTQESSMDKLCAMIGYNRHYYRSATTNIALTYLGKLNSTEDDATDIEKASSFTLKAFKTTFKTSENVVYTLLQDIVINDNNRSVSGKLAIEGELSSLSVLGSTSIQLQNLDSNNRIYFPNTNVAENGIIINNQYYTLENENVWHRVDNLNDQALGSFVYKFGYDSDKGYPYLEFPSDIADLIGSGLTIDYIISTGTAGKVANGDITTCNSITIILPDDTTASASLPEDTYTIANSSSLGASDPETITDSYNNAKKVVGTFSTLVSAKDYSNYLNTYTDTINNKVVSNVVATDLRTDPQFSKKILLRDAAASSYFDVILSDSAQEHLYDITLRGFTPVNRTINTLALYNLTYSDLVSSDLVDIQDVLSDVKSLTQSTILPLTTSTWTDSSIDIFTTILGKYKLSVNIIPKYKVSITEESDIINNVKEALYKNFNSQKLDFGQEIPYDSLVSVMENADTRIKAINLSEPEITYAYKTNNEEFDFSLTGDSSNNKPFNTLVSTVADNILAGCLPLYYFDDTFTYSYAQDITTADTTPLMGIVANPVISTTIEKNQAVQLVKKSFIAQHTYPVGVYYSFKSSSTTPIAANTTYKLKSNEYLYINYTDSEDVVQKIKYKEGDVVKANFSLYDGSSGKIIAQSGYKTPYSTTASKFYNAEFTEEDTTATADNHTAGDICLYYIGTSEQIELLKENGVTLPKTSKAFWYIKPRIVKKENTYKIDNSQGDLIFTNGYYVLEEDEYFIYPSDDMLSLNICGAGTRIESSSNLIRKNNQVIDLTTLINATEDYDTTTFEKTFAWETLSGVVNIYETNSTTYIEGDTIAATFDSDTTDITTSWKTPKTLKVNEEPIALAEIESPIIRSVQSITCSADNPISTTNLSIIDSTGNAVSTNNSLLQTSSQVDSYNDLCVLGIMQYTQEGSHLIPKKSGDDYEYLFSTSAYIYSNSNTNTPAATLNYLGAKAISDNIAINSRQEYTISYVKFKEYMSSITSKTFTLSSKDGFASAYVFDTISCKTQIVTNTQSCDLSEFINGESGNLYIHEPTVLKTYDYLKISDNFNNTLKTKLQTYTSFDPFGEKNTYNYITSYTPIFSFFDPNNIYNKMTIAKIDFENSKFNVVGGNLRYATNK